jgi:hypothetical protein
MGQLDQNHLKSASQITAIDTLRLKKIAMISASISWSLLVFNLSIGA